MGNRIVVVPKLFFFFATDSSICSLSCPQWYFCKTKFEVHGQGKYQGAEILSSLL